MQTEVGVMSLPDQEAAALEAARKFMLGVCSNKPLRPISEVRAEARQIMRHFPLDPAGGWLRAAPPPMSAHEASRRYDLLNGDGVVDDE